MDKEEEDSSYSLLADQQSKTGKAIEYSLSAQESKQLEDGILDRYSMDKEKLTTTTRKGGLITMPFIIANEAFEKIANFGLTPNMIFYLMNGYNMSLAKGNNILFLWSAAYNFLPMVGAFLADSYLGRFLTIGLGCIFSLLGMIALWLTAMIPGAKPPSCVLIPPCKSATAGQYALLIASFSLMAIGAGGIRSSSMAFGADQLDNKDNPDNGTILERYFGWYYAATTASVLVAFTAIVYIQDHMGMIVGFGVPAILMFLSALLFFLASSFYIKHKATSNLFTGFAQVFVAAYKNRKLTFPLQDSIWYHYQKGSIYTMPTEKLRCLNKACIVRNPEDVTPSGIAFSPWSLCTVEQVEELKTLIRVIPIWLAGAMMSINTCQSSFPVLQASTMNRHVTSNFQIPAGSFVMFTIITITIWVVMYDRAILPLASKIRGRPVHIGTKERMGIGIVFSGMSMVVSGIVEHVRRKKTIEQGFLNNPGAIVNMSAMWLVPQNVLVGLAEAFNAIGQTEFYYSELPKRMSSVASSLFGLGMAVANLFASVMLSMVDKYTKGEGKESWVSSNINKGHYEYYYWLLGIISLVNLIYFVICCWAYRPPWSQVVPPSSPPSCVTSLNNNLLLNLSGTKAEAGNHQHLQNSSECNSSTTSKMPMIQHSSAQPAPKGRKEKLGDKIAALQRLVSPFGKTDTASVLAEAIGYIKFHQEQVQVLTSTNYRGGSMGEGHSQQCDVQDRPKDLRSRGLCLVPLSCAQPMG